MRKNGGWENWDIIEIRKLSCVDAEDATEKVNQYYNRIIQYGDIHICQICNIDLNTEDDLKNHYRESHNRGENYFDDLKNVCDCGKIYKHRSTLSTHRKKCSIANQVSELPRITPEFVLEIVKQNNDFQQLILTQNQQFQNTLVEQVQTTQTQLVELAKNQQTINNSLVQNNCDNRTQFSINIFLNQDCKDAIDINQFVDSISVSVSDFIATGEMGHVSGISRIITNKLRELDVYQRPIHCTDAKRETIYIKNKDGWERETDDKPHFREVVHKVTNKNLKQLPAWQRQNPRFSQINTEENEKFIQYSLAALGNESNDENKDVDRIMHTVSKDIVIDKKIQQFAVK